MRVSLLQVFSCMRGLLCIHYYISIPPCNKHMFLLSTYLWFLEGGFPIFFLLLVDWFMNLLFLVVPTSRWWFSFNFQLYAIFFLTFLYSSTLVYKFISTLFACSNCSCLASLAPWNPLFFLWVSGKSYFLLCLDKILL